MAWLFTLMTVWIISAGSLVMTILSTSETGSNISRFEFPFFDYLHFGFYLWLTLSDLTYPPHSYHPQTSPEQCSWCDYLVLISDRQCWASQSPCLRDLLLCAWCSNLVLAPAFPPLGSLVACVLPDLDEVALWIAALPWDLPPWLLPTLARIYILTHKLGAKCS